METPRHLEDFSRISTDILQRAHDNSLELYETSVSPLRHRDLDQVLIEKRNPFQQADREFLAIHLGRETLTVCLEHHHLDEYPESFTRLTYPRVSVHFEHGEARAYYSRVIREGETERITDNEEAGLELTDRLYHTLAVLGIDATRYETTDATTEFLEAS